MIHVSRHAGDTSAHPKPISLQNHNLIVVHRLMLTIVKIRNVILRLLTVTLRDGKGATGAKQKPGNLRQCERPLSEWFPAKRFCIWECLHGRPAGFSSKRNSIAAV